MGGVSNFPPNCIPAPVWSQRNLSVLAAVEKRDVKMRRRPGKPNVRFNRFGRIQFLKTRLVGNIDGADKVVLVWRKARPIGGN